MPRSVNERLSDAVVSHDVDLSRLDAKTRRTLVRSLEQLQADISEEIARRAPTGVTRASARLQRLQRLLASTDAMIRSAYKDTNRVLARSMVDFAEISHDAVANALEGNLGLTPGTIGLTPTQLKAVASNLVVEGAVIREHMGRQSARVRNAVRDQMRMGLLAGESVPQMQRRLEQVMPGAQHELQALARTSALTVQNEARLTLYRENEDIIKGMQAVVTLDTRTSQLCQGRSGWAWNNDGTPIDSSGATIDFPGPPPWHWNCRTTLVPITRSFAELGARTKAKIPKSKQRAMDGSLVPGNQTYERWLKRQPRAVQIRALGRTRWELWRRGRGLTLREMLDQDGRPLSADALRRKHARKKD